MSNFFGGLISSGGLATVDPALASLLGSSDDLGTLLSSASAELTAGSTTGSASDLFTVWTLSSPQPSPSPSPSPAVLASPQPSPSPMPLVGQASQVSSTQLMKDLHTALDAASLALFDFPHLADLLGSECSYQAMPPVCPATTPSTR